MPHAIRPNIIKIILHHDAIIAIIDKFLSVQTYIIIHKVEFRAATQKLKHVCCKNFIIVHAQGLTNAVTSGINAFFVL